MLTVITPATNKRLTTVSTVRDELGITVDQASDAKVGRWIDAASQAIVDYCGREFAEQTYLEDFYAHNCARVLLSVFPVTTMDELTYGGGAPFAPDGYLLDARYLYRLSAAGYPTYWGPLRISAQYVAGYTLPDPANAEAPYTLPRTVELAALSEIRAQQSRAERDPFVRSETVEGVGATTYQIASVGGAGPLASPESAGLLSPYRLVRIG